MKIKFLAKLIQKALEDEEKELLFRMYLTDRPHIDKKGPKTFTEYYEKYRTPRYEVDTRSKDEIMEELIKIQKKVS